MNLQKVREIIELYKKHFHAISNEEIYKWRAVKHFQENWNIEADNFSEMLEESLRYAKNLLDSGQYFPKRMLLLYATIEPETVRNLFVALFNEETDWVERIEDFQEGLTIINENYFPERATYQDDRAVLVYLALRFPDIYFLYKFTMFKDFVNEIDYPFRPIKGRIENLTVYSNLCELLRSEIVKDAELLELHEKRLSQNHFFDKSFNILTQDLIYASVKHFKRFELNTVKESAQNRLTKINKNIEVNSASPKIVLKGSFSNYIEKEKAKKRIGDLGELLVLEYEKEKLIRLGSKKQPEHISTTKGDGEGYDILSYDEFGKEMYIEVKTTKKSYNTPFFITSNELVRSEMAGQKFYLYRLYDYNEEKGTAKFRVKHGSLESLCTTPVVYRVNVEDNTDDFGNV